MQKNSEKPVVLTGQIAPEKTLPDFLSKLAGKILYPYHGPTDDCVLPNECAVMIADEPHQFYGVHKDLVQWRA